MADARCDLSPDRAPALGSDGRDAVAPDAALVVTGTPGDQVVVEAIGEALALETAGAWYTIMQSFVMRAFEPQANDA